MIDCHFQSINCIVDTIDNDLPFALKYSCKKAKEKEHGNLTALHIWFYIALTLLSFPTFYVFFCTHTEQGSMEIIVECKRIERDLRKGEEKKAMVVLAIAWHVLFSTHLNIHHTYTHVNMMYINISQKKVLNKTLQEENFTIVNFYWLLHNDNPICILAQWNFLWHFYININWFYLYVRMSH